MKINWGTGIVISILAFISFILFFVLKMNTNNKYNYHLVSEKYYQKELNYQEEINAAKNTAKLTTPIKLVKTKKGLQIYFPKELNTQNITGKMFLYRPSNKQLDFEMSISFSNPYLLVPESRLLDGRWNITLSFKHKNTPYLFKKELMY